MRRHIKIASAILVGIVLGSLVFDLVSERVVTGGSGRMPDEAVRLSHEHGVFMDPVVYGNLVHLYEGQSDEIPLCLHGRRVGSDSVFIDRVSFPRISRSAPGETLFTAMRCMDGSYVGVVHNHDVPRNGTCLPSPTDRKGFHKDFLASVAVIACRYPDGKVFLMGRYKW